MKLIPLRIELEISSSANMRISCFKCNIGKRYNDAAKSGWKADIDSNPFGNYYCPECISKIKEK
jgi:hypothetical protein